ncbi:anthranilate synthase component I [Thiorhodospira sibirica]|uniref:anthranilate synthase component I n=1 Tax=Thiorhodospira sibirica TaxID=154347 RepID=UPI00022C586F|nr:anthranilate synthase component I [Thiorhodospira sibirica]
MTPEQFNTLIEQGYNRIPLVKEILADLDTPLSVYLKLASMPYSCLLESVQGGEKWGRYSIVGLPAKTVLKVYGQQVLIEEDGQIVERQTVDDPLAFIEAYQARYRVPEHDGLPRFTGGLVGYFGYETIEYIEPRLRPDTPKADPLEVPDILLMLCDELVVYDNLAGRLYLVVHAKPDGLSAAEARLADLYQRLQAPLTPPATTQDHRRVAESDFISGFTEEGFKAAVERCRRYIIDGDVMQVVLSQRLSIPFKARPLDLYRALRCLNPSPYMFYLDLGDHQVVGASPEILVRLEHDTVTVRPIAGTRPRGETPEKDVQLEADLLADPKECAEHLMLIDLGRNDAGRVSATGTVRVTEQMVVERYSHVMHIVSNVEGRLQPGLKAMDVLRATFPAGTVSGAPKVRAMEIIAELEPVKRGVYSGAVGYLSWQGNMDTAIAIRTAVIKNHTLHIQAGAGIVYDSLPDNEWAETLNKGRAVFRAVAMVEAGLDGPKAPTP